jgi:predicted DNA binding CopG/RHH family protein
MDEYSLKTKRFTLTIPENICRRFKQKAEQEGIEKNKIIEQFMRNYNNFIKNCQKVAK